MANPNRWVQTELLVIFSSNLICTFLGKHVMHSLHSPGLWLLHLRHFFKGFFFYMVRNLWCYPFSATLQYIFQASQFPDETYMKRSIRRFWYVSYRCLKIDLWSTWKDIYTSLPRNIVLQKIKMNKNHVNSYTKQLLRVDD